MNNQASRPSPELRRLEDYAAEGGEARRVHSIFNEWNQARRPRRELISLVDEWRRHRASVTQDPKERARLEHEIGSRYVIVWTNRSRRGRIDLKRLEYIR